MLASQPWPRTRPHSVLCVLLRVTWLGLLPPREQAGAGGVQGRSDPVSRPLGPPWPPCPLGLALTRIGGTRVMVGVGTSFVAAPDGGPGFLAAGTGLARREGSWGESAVGPSRTTPPPPQKSVGRRLQVARGLILWQPRARMRGPSWGRGMSNLTDKCRTSWVRIPALPFCAG